MVRLMPSDNAADAAEAPEYKNRVAVRFTMALVSAGQRQVASVILHVPLLLRRLLLGGILQAG